MTIPGTDVLRAPHLRGARGLFTTRAGGVGEEPYDSLNLALHVGDREEDVRANRERAALLIGAPLAAVEQVHSADVLRIGPDADPRDLPVVRADAMVSAREDLALMIMVADCLPVLLVDPEARVIGAAHAGRRGLLDGVLEATVSAMQELGARPAGILAATGPSICGSCYEVPAQMREESAALLPSTAATTSWGTPALDLRAGAVEALGRAGVPAAAISAQPPCTLEDERFFSYRRAARTGRLAGIIRLETP